MRSGRTFLDRFANPKQLERSNRSPPVTCLIELLLDETATQLISQSMTPVFEGLERGKQRRAAVYVCVGIMS